MDARSKERKKNRQIVVWGGADDWHLDVFSEAVRQKGGVVQCRFGAGLYPVVCWDLRDGTLRWDKKLLDMECVFARHNVFGDSEDSGENPFGDWKDVRKASEEYQTLLVNYLHVNPDVRAFNRGVIQGGYSTKAMVLMHAAQLGIAIPQTVISTSVPPDKCRGVHKPLSGGDYCRKYAEDKQWGRLVGEEEQLVYACPRFFQERLRGVEVRVFVIVPFDAGETVVHAFNVESEHVDYREHQEDMRVSYLPRFSEENKKLCRRLRTLCDRLGVGGVKGGGVFVCFDVKDGVLLEMNEQPMFGKWDGVARGALSTSIAAALLGD